MKKALISDVPTGIITSSNDIISSLNAIDLMVENWRIKDLKLFETQSTHLNSFRDHPEEYKDFCIDVFERAL